MILCNKKTYIHTNTLKCARAHTHTPVKDNVATLVLVRGIIGLTVRVVGVLMVGLLTRLAVLATWVTK